MAQVKKRPAKPPFLFHSLTLTEQDNVILRSLGQDARDCIGRAVSTSAIMRALIRYAGQQSEAWAREHLFPIVEQEMNAGVLWGGKKGS
jgi:hypothetical protein